MLGGSKFTGSGSTGFLPSLKRHCRSGLSVQLGATLMFVLLLAGLVSGCKRSQTSVASSSQSNPSNYFKTPFQDESQFVVREVVSDLAEEIYYAKFHRLPDAKYFQVTVVENPGFPVDAPDFSLQISLDSKTSGLKSEVHLTNAIWSPEAYESIVKDLADAVGLVPSSDGGMGDTSLISDLTDGTAATIEQENETISSSLQDDFTNPVLHEEAAVLLGAFMLREHSGYFFDIRFPLSRMTAHLAMAHFLDGSRDYGINGRMAMAMLLTLVGDEAPALKQLDALDNHDASVESFASALRILNTGDYLSRTQAQSPSRIESIARFFAMAQNVGDVQAWTMLNDLQMQSIDFVRLADQDGYSVEMGHQLLAVALPLEFQEIGNIYQLSQHKTLTEANLVAALNVLPERCFTETDNGVQVRVIGWGQWAAFLQRQLCSAIQQNFYMLQYMWGVPDDAKAFAAKSDQTFGGLRLYPFVRRFDCTDVESYHSSVDDGFKVTVATPQFVSAECWNYLCYETSFAPLYAPNPNPHVNEWFNHNPLPGTVYDLTPRLNHPSLVNRPDAIAFFEKLHQLAPYDTRISYFMFHRKYNDHPTYDEAMDLFSNVMPYNVTADWAVAATLTNQPDQFEKLVLQAALLNPSYYYYLGDYFLNRNDNDKAAQYYDLGCSKDPDSVSASYYASWRMRYYLEKGQLDKAREIADEGAQVYSSAGLEAEALFFELTSNYDEAYDWYSKIEDRYNESGPLVAFCMRYKILTGDTRFDAEVQKRIGTLFPGGLEKVSLSDFHGPPTDGVLVEQENDRTKAAGLKQGDVIVAVYSYRMHNFKQYSWGREWSTEPELDLIVWQDGTYREIKANLPSHLFGVTFGDYTW